MHVKDSGSYHGAKFGLWTSRVCILLNNKLPTNLSITNKTNLQNPPFNMNLGIKLNTSTNQMFFGCKKAFQQLFFQPETPTNRRWNDQGFQPWQPLKEAFEPGSGRRHWGPCLQWWAYRAWWASWWPRCVRGEGLFVLEKMCGKREKTWQISDFFCWVVVRW